MSSKAHDRENLGLGGRRVQVSRAWSGKTLSEHRADRATVVREVLKEAGIEAPDADRMTVYVLADDGFPRFVWEDIPVADRDYVQVVMGAVREAQRWRREYERAKAHVGARASPSHAAGSVDSNSAPITLVLSTIRRPHHQDGREDEGPATDTREFEMEQVDLPGDRLWTVAETSYFLGVPVGTLNYCRCRGGGA